ncbi:GNAT family N-acetyltransferase [Engelhardtia mirabilis]|uniref:Ribosomal N-acetyltransferase YdaF n=1 Tax=Engelhardtia mirabilis TaxID=2528011 RepID=A0A518BS72_9BACT|nr:Putative ribosomal N-acetyltransferase YdaF [Planctomycetes bacterium Pla133]QDV04144.1 Putative ribosomal N-acetyltransferase YdaF [Planctomycetes bacterium Pla86]
MSDERSIDLSAPPVIETARLRLRPFVEDDAPRLTALLEAFEVVEFTAGYPHPFGLDDARRQLERQRHLAEAGQAVHWAIEPIETPPGSLNGLCGGVLAKLDAPCRNAELGYWLGRNAWGRGFATEAGRAVIDWCFGAWNANRVEAHHVARNPSSGRVLEKLGMQQEGHLRQRQRRWERFEDVILYAVLRGEWQAR